VQLNCT